MILDPSTLLSQLRDIHVPEQISIWPLAIGWWFLILLSVSCITYLIFLVVKKHLNGAWKRQAIKKISELSKAYNSDPSRENLLKISRLLKQAISTSKQSRKYLNLSGEAWALELEAIHRKGSSILEKSDITILSSELYTPQPSQLDSKALERISLWIKHLG